MRLSLFMFLNDRAEGTAPIDGYVAELAAARDEGYATVWTPQLPFEHDLVVTLAVALREVDGIAVGSAVIPIQSRLPMILAQQALTLDLIAPGRFKLGIGMTHAMVTEGMWGIPWDRPVRRLNDYLDGLLPLLHEQKADATGETVTTRGALMIPGAATVPVYVAALGPQLLKVTGRRTAGTITWMTGAKTLADHVVPSLRAAAPPTGRRAEVVVGLPIAVTADVAGTRAFATESLQFYGALPSYRAMLDREGLAEAGDVAIIGDEDEVAAQIEALAATGIDELAVNVLRRHPDDVARTREFLRRYLPAR